MNHEEDKNFWGIPYATEISAEAFLKDIWDPSTEEIVKPKQFLGIGWGINLHAIAKKTGILR
ncbi:hypothetical protein LPTSP4_20770 [Leptospira ryugenii]|uniref:DUF5808 domain-containing protein n=1 Tax=Leptospira ryugenii TaxID=1917863 RepID=A0A2P2E0Z1_9LEPT|nr:hypothetical protein [Leptospira ryugenii]GBF50551.1 hypothetical protein LPTSP4_20770 [Leptospira ryugenii]